MIKSIMFVFSLMLLSMKMSVVIISEFN